LIVLLVSCGGGGVTPPTNDPPPIDIPEPKPLEVSVTMDESRALSRSIPVGGGTLSLTAEDGAVYTLTIPPDALLEATDITMTPILTIEGSPISGGRLLGVELKPHGLRLNDLATLTITLPGGGTGEAIAFSAQEGQEFHLYPLELDPTRVSLKLIHFSEYGVYVRGENDPIPVNDPEVSDTVTIEIMPFDWEAQLEQMLADLVRKERRAQLKGQAGDPQFNAKVEAIVNTFYDKVVKGMLGQIATDCGYAEANISKVLGWSRAVSLWGLDEKLAAKTRAVSEAALKGADNCWKTSVGACIDRQNTEQLRNVTRHARLNQIMGGDPAKYNPDDPRLRCPDPCDEALAAPSWAGSIILSYQQSGEESTENGTASVTILRTAAVRFTLDEKLEDARPWAAGWWGTLTEGTAEIFDTHTTTSPWGSQHYEIKGSGTPNLGNRGPVKLYLSADCTDYTFKAHVSIDAKNDHLKGNVAPSTVAEVVFFSMPAQRPTPRPLELGGNGFFSVENRQEPHVNLVGGGTYLSGYSSLLRNMVGAQNMGKADVAWVITPTSR
jgi:hypothetical protein